MKLFNLFKINQKGKLKPLSLEESKKRCKKINATSKEIREAKKLVRYICKNCGYHKDKNWNGKLRRCNVCGGWLRYWELYERILDNRIVEEQFLKENEKTTP